MAKREVFGFLEINVLEWLFRARSARPVPDAASSGIVGWVDGVRNGRLIGWACESATERRLTILLPGAKGGFVSTRADLYRADAQRAGYSKSGYCGFCCPVARLSLASPVQIFVDQPRVALDASAVVKGGAPAPARISRIGEYEMMLDPVGMRISGWIRSRVDPRGRPTLRLVADGRLVGKARATLFRADLESRHGDAFHGFAFRVAEGASECALRDDDTGVELRRIVLKGRPGEQR